MVLCTFTLKCGRQKVDAMTFSKVQLLAMFASSVALGFGLCWFFVALPNYRQSGDLALTSVIGNLSALHTIRKGGDPVPHLESSVDLDLGIFAEFYPDHPGKAQTIRRVQKYYRQSGKPLPYELGPVVESIEGIPDDGSDRFPALWGYPGDTFYPIYWP
jgi:hypothetical protein